MLKLVGCGMVRKIFLTFLLLTVSYIAGLAQIYQTQYRPPHQDWQYLATPHFKILYSAGNDSSAREMGQILESQYSNVQKLVGGGLNDFPVILNDYNDRSNGFVSPFNFRSEIELPPTKGKTLNPKNGDWLENVAPHELTHAMQFSHLQPPNIISWFSPDLARSFHSAIPSGVLEGLAVYNETQNVTKYGGRGNYPLFTNTFSAIFNSSDRWSMGQMVQISSHTRPFNRHYIGGYEFTNWLQQTYGPSTSKEALSFYMNFPFLGYGIALRHETGLWPAQLYHRFEDKKGQQLTNKSSSSKSVALEIPFEGRDIHRPKWKNDSTLIFYGSFYNARSGFYSYNLHNNHTKRLVTTNTISDYRYDLNDNHSAMIFSYYRSSTLFNNTYKAELKRYDFSTHQTQKITQHGRTYAPFFSGDSLYALQTKPASARLVKIDAYASKTANLQHLLLKGDFELKSIAVNPKNHGQWAIVANKDGLQGLWIAEKNQLGSTLAGPPDIAFKKSSVFDLVWRPDGQKIMFSSGFSGTFQLYEYDLNNQVVHQLTNQPYNALEGSYSPDGSQIAFIKQIGSEQLPALLKRKDFLDQTVDNNLWHYGQQHKPLPADSVITDSVAEASKSWSSSDFSTGLSWLKPRIFYPFAHEVSNTEVYQIGLATQSADLLSNQKYKARISALKDRLWYDVHYRNTSFFPGFQVRLYNQPSYNSFTVDNKNKPSEVTLLRQERSFSLGVPLIFHLNRNVFNTSLYLKPEIKRSQTRFLNYGSLAHSTDYARNTIAKLYAQLNFRLQQNARDVQPNAGLSVFAEVQQYFSSDGLKLSLGNKTNTIFNGQPRALQGGVIGYLSPLRRWNQSLRISLRGLTQSGLIYDNQDLVSEAFSEPVLVGSNNEVSFSTRYTIPLAYPDNGGFLLPFYLSDIYLVAFTNSLANPSDADFINHSRTVFGLGLRGQFRISNLSFEIGVGIGYEPTRNNTQFFIGDF